MDKISIRTLEFLLEGLDVPLLARVTAASLEGKKSMEVDDVQDLALLVQCAGTRRNRATGYIKGQCGTVWYSGNFELGQRLAEKVESTALWIHAEAELLACWCKPRTYTPAGIAEPTPYELATSYVLEASQEEIDELSAVTGMRTCHHETLVSLLLAPLHNIKKVA